MAEMTPAEFWARVHVLRPYGELLEMEADLQAARRLSITRSRATSIAQSASFWMLLSVALMIISSRVRFGFFRNHMVRAPGRRWVAAGRDGPETGAPPDGPAA